MVTPLASYPSHPPKTASELATKLISGGLNGVSHKTLTKHIQQVGYFRLKGYWYPFLTPDANNPRKRRLPFMPGTYFRTIWKNYIFDQELRALAFDGIATIETYLKNYLATQLSLFGGEFGYMNTNGLPQLTFETHIKCIQDLRRSCTKSALPYLKHFCGTYNEPIPPYWMVVGCLTYGSLKTYFYEGAPTEIQKALAKNLKLLTPNSNPSYQANVKMLSNWLETIRVVRNMIAHHDRFWNENNRKIQPQLPQHLEAEPNWWGNMWDPFRPKGGSATFLTMENFLLTKGLGSNRWHRRFISFMHRNNHINATEMGFPDYWESMQLWQ